MAWQARSERNYTSDEVSEEESSGDRGASTSRRKPCLSSRCGQICLGSGWICGAFALGTLIYVLLRPVDVKPLPKDIALAKAAPSPKMHCYPVNTEAAGVAKALASAPAAEKKKKSEGVIDELEDEMNDLMGSSDEDKSSSSSTSVPASNTTTQTTTGLIVTEYPSMKNGTEAMTTQNPVTTIWSQDILPRRLQIVSSTTRFPLAAPKAPVATPPLGLPPQTATPGIVTSPPAAAGSSAATFSGPPPVPVATAAIAAPQSTTTVTTCVPVHGKSSIPDVIPVASVGHCTNMDDLAIYQGTGMSGFHVAMNQCSRKCWARASCVADCFEDLLGYSSGCGRCFANVPSCTMTSCLLDCVSDSPKCGKCSSEKCLPAFSACAGVDPRNSTDFGLNKYGMHPNKAMMAKLGLTVSEAAVGAGVQRAIGHVAVHSAAVPVAVAAVFAATFVAVVGVAVARRSQLPTMREDEAVEALVATC